MQNKEEKALCSVVLSDPRNTVFNENNKNKTL